MPDQACLRGFVVVGSNLQQSICARLFGLLGKPNSIVGVVAPRTCDNRNPPSYMLNGEPYRLHMLLISECGCLAGCACHDDRIRTILNLVVDQFAKQLPVDRLIRTHRSNDRNASTGKDGLFFHLLQTTFLSSNY